MSTCRQLAGIELMHMIRKGQMHDDGFAKTAAEQFYSLVTSTILIIFRFARPARLIATQPDLAAWRRCRLFRPRAGACCVSRRLGSTGEYSRRWHVAWLNMVVGGRRDSRGRLSRTGVRSVGRARAHAREYRAALYRAGWSVEPGNSSVCAPCKSPARSPQLAPPRLY